MARSGYKRPDQPGKLESTETLELNSQKEESNDTLCTVLAETNMKRDMHDEEEMVKS